MYSEICPCCGSMVPVPRFMPISITCKKCGNLFEVQYDPVKLGFWGRRKLHYNNFVKAHPIFVKCVKALIIITGIVFVVIFAILKYVNGSESDTAQDSRSDEPDASIPSIPAPQMTTAKKRMKPVKPDPEVEIPAPKTDFEKHLLERLAAGELDGPVGSPCGNNYGSTIMYWIEGGDIKRYKQGPTQSFFNGEETEKIIPDWKNDLTYTDDDAKLNYLRRSGRHVNDPEVQEYSNNYWDDYWDKKHQS